MHSAAASIPGSRQGLHPACLRQQEGKHHAQAGLDVLQRQVFSGAAAVHPAGSASGRPGQPSVRLIKQQHNMPFSAVSVCPVSPAHLKRGMRPVTAEKREVTADTSVSILTSRWWAPICRAGEEAEGRSSLLARQDVTCTRGEHVMTVQLADLLRQLSGPVLRLLAAVLQGGAKKQGSAEALFAACTGRGQWQSPPRAPHMRQHDGTLSASDLHLPQCPCRRCAARDWQGLARPWAAPPPHTGPPCSRRKEGGGAEAGLSAAGKPHSEASMPCRAVSQMHAHLTASASTSSSPSAMAAHTIWHMQPAMAATAELSAPPDSGSKKPLAPELRAQGGEESSGSKQ